MLKFPEKLVCPTNCCLSLLRRSLVTVTFASSDDWIEWSKTYGGIEDDGEFHLVYLVQTFDGGITIAANTRSFGSGFSDCWLIRADSSGNIEWSRTYGGEDLDFGQSLVETLDGGFVLAGNTKSFGAGGYDVWLIKTNSLGIPEFPSWIILPLFLTITLVTFFIKKKMDIHHPK